MNLYSPLFIAARIIGYSLLIFGIAQGIFFDAGHPVNGGYFGEITFTEICQEVILFAIFCFYLFIGYKIREIQPFSNLLSLFFLISFFREFNFLPLSWTIPAALAFIVFILFVIRDFKKIKASTIAFFSNPASSWFLSGWLITFVFSRLFGRSKFWLLMYPGDNYRLAKAASEEGIELLGYFMMLISAIEFLFFYLSKKSESIK